LVGNKCDLPHAVQQSEVNEFMKEKEQIREYIEVSALTGQNVNELFTKAAGYYARKNVGFNFN